MSDERNFWALPYKAVDSLNEAIHMLAFMGTAVTMCSGTMTDETAQGASELFYAIEMKLKDIQASIKILSEVNEDPL